ncbi:hypothetical protein [Cellulophaga baltica]|uniref:hypothetical protein n=1 Tax=Cellulophaga baltica TaxID=76594 RepID=UPI0015F669F9|nr:hypothetical protein [Cellulophaga baltica]MBA6316879.1 hypothetical protein [Cellulophaga baltica]
MKKLILLFLSSLFISCNFGNKKTNNTNQEIKELEPVSSREKSEDIEIDSVVVINNEVAKNLKLLATTDSLKTILKEYKYTELESSNFKTAISYEHYLKMPYRKVSLSNKHLNPSSFISDVKEHFNLSKDNDVIRSLTNNWDYYIIENSERKFLPYYFSKEKRSSNYLRTLFTEDFVNLIISSLKETEIYEASKLNKYVEVLLKAYDNMDQDDLYILEELHNLSITGYRNNEQEIRLLLNNLDQINEDIFETAFKNRSYGNTNGVFHVYSFWARRQHEGNMETVYWLMKKIQKEAAINTQEEDNSLLLSEKLERIQYFNEYEQGNIRYLEAQLINIKDSLENNKKQLALHKKAVDSLVKYENKEQYFASFFNKFHFDGIYSVECSLISNKYWGGPLEELNLIRRLLYTLDRTPDNINSILSDDNLELIISFIPKEDFNKFGFNDLLNAMIISYQELDNEMLEEISDITSLNDTDYYEYYSDTDDDLDDFKMNFINRIASEEVKDDIINISEYKKDGFKEFMVRKYDNKCIIGTPNLLFYVYSFWGRRYKEGNKEAVYAILKEFRSKIEKQ